MILASQNVQIAEEKDFVREKISVIFFQLNPPMAEEIHLRWMKSLCDEICPRQEMEADLVSSEAERRRFHPNEARISSRPARFHFSLPSCALPQKCAIINPERRWCYEERRQIISSTCFSVCVSCCRSDGVVLTSLHAD